jgi:chemotaxis protein MotB
MRRRKKGVDDGGLTGQEWLATFSDTMTLLLTFFILLYSFSTVDAEKFKQVSESLRSVLTGSSGESVMELYNSGDVPLVGEIEASTEVSVAAAEQNRSMYEEVKAFVEKNNLQEVVHIIQDSRGVIIQLRDNIIFQSGSADIINESKPILDQISGLINTFHNEINVEGHTDNIPIKTSKYESNWELSTARAGSVLRYFVEVRGLNPVRFKASGYAEYKPVAANDTAENRAKNRRVQILIVTNEKESGTR